MPNVPKHPPPPPPSGNKVEKLIDEISKLNKESLAQVKKYIDEITGV